jgi:succinate dehydrogenase flavin-adding protein (antitoxin of CptAB toxin-antitoxin module)
MLELDLVLTAFLERYLADLQPHQLDCLFILLERPDPELLDFVMGHSDPAAVTELELVELMRGVNAIKGSVDNHCH